MFLEKEKKKIRGKEPLTLTEAKEISVFSKKYIDEVIDKWN